MDERVRYLARNALPGTATALDCGQCPMEGWRIEIRGMDEMRFANLSLSGGIGLSLTCHPILLHRFRNFAEVLRLTLSSAPLYDVVGICPGDTVEPAVQWHTRQGRLAGPGTVPVVSFGACPRSEEPEVYCARAVFSPYPPAHETCPAKPRKLLQPLFLDVIAGGGLLCHGGLAEFQGKGIVLAGASGVGKSTSMHRLEEEGAEGFKVLSDDTLMLVKTREGAYAAHPLPTWSRCERLLPAECREVGRAVPLRAIYFIQQAERDEVTPLQRIDAAARLSTSALQGYPVPLKSPHGGCQRELRAGVFNNAVEMTTHVPCFLLKVSIKGWFWELIAQSLTATPEGHRP